MSPQPVKRQIILHAGFHKTGTKSLQACLRANADRLPAAWRVQTRPDSTDLRALVEAARVFSASGDKADLAMVSAQTVLWLGGLDLQPGQGLLVSSEDFAGHMPGRFGVTDYSALTPVLLAVVTMAARFYDGQVQAQILLTGRAAHPWLRSLYFQQAKHPDLTDDFDTFCAALPNAADHAAIAATLRRKLGSATPVHLHTLEDLSPRRLGPAHAMFDLAQLPTDDLTPAQAHNAMPAPGLAEAYVAANRLGLPVPDLKRMKEDLLKAAVSLGTKLG